MKRPVTLHVYALSETGGAKFISRLGLGLWHSGLEVGGKEYFFSAGKGGDMCTFSPQCMLQDIVP